VGRRDDGPASRRQPSRHAQRSAATHPEPYGGSGLTVASDQFADGERDPWRRPDRARAGLLVVHVTTVPACSRLIKASARR
jgi:hypothetical protein